MNPTLAPSRRRSLWLGSSSAGTKVLIDRDLNVKRRWRCRQCERPLLACVHDPPSVRWRRFCSTPFFSGPSASGPIRIGHLAGDVLPAPGFPRDPRRASSWRGYPASRSGYKSRRHNVGLMIGADPAVGVDTASWKWRRQKGLLDPVQSANRLFCLDDLADEVDAAFREDVRVAGLWRGFRAGR